MQPIKPYSPYLPSSTPYQRKSSASDVVAQSLKSARWRYRLTVLALAVFGGWWWLLRAATAGEGTTGVSGRGGLCQGMSRVWCQKYGAVNILRSRLHAGSSTRLHHLFRQQNKRNRLRMVALGGSVTLGHGWIPQPSIWPNRLTSLLNNHFLEANEASNAEMHIGAVPAVGSDYFSKCWINHVGLNGEDGKENYHVEDIDIFFIELSINDLYAQTSSSSSITSAESFEILLRSLLSLPQNPAVVVLQTIGLEHRTVAVGGDTHLSVAAYYDVPVIALRPLVLPQIMKKPDTLGSYFARDGWGNPDLRHIGEATHHALAEMTLSFLIEQYEFAASGGKISDLEGRKKVDDGSSRGWWPSEEEKGYGDVAVLRMFEKFNVDAKLKPMTPPQCFSTAKGSLLPLETTSSDGWDLFTPSQTPDKTYIRSIIPHSKFTTRVTIQPCSLGVISIGYLRSSSLNLGTALCSVYSSGTKPSEGTRLVGYWPPENPNIIQFIDIAKGLDEGTYEIVCEILDESGYPAEQDDEGKREVRVQSVVAL